MTSCARGCRDALSLPALWALAVFPPLLSMTRSAIAATEPLGGKPLVVVMKTGSLRTLDPDNAYEAEWFIFGKALYSQLVTLRGSTSIP